MEPKIKYETSQYADNFSHAVNEKHNFFLAKPMGDLHQ